MRHGTMDQYAIINGVSAVVLILQLLLMCSLGGSAASSTDCKYLSRFGPSIYHSVHGLPSISPSDHFLAASSSRVGVYSRIPTNLHRVHPTSWMNRELRGTSQSICHSTCRSRSLLLHVCVAMWRGKDVMCWWRIRSKPTINCDNRDGIRERVLLHISCWLPTHPSIRLLIQHPFLSPTTSLHND